MSKTTRMTITASSRSATDIANNRTKITVKGYIKCDSGSYRTNKTLTWTIKVNGTRVTTSGTSSVGTTAASGSRTASAAKSTDNLMVDWTGYVTHDANGECSVSASFDFYSSWATASTSQTLSKILRASTITVPNFTMGTSSNITITSYSDAYTHTLTYAFGSKTGTIASGISTSSLTKTQAWNAPINTLASEIPTAESGTGTITCTTYSGNTAIGTDTKSFTAVLPSSVKPTNVSVACSELTAGIAVQFGAYIQSKSAVRTTITADAPSGGSIKTYKVEIAGQIISGSSNVLDSAVISQAGSLTVNVTVTDSRNRTAQTSTTITVLAYSPPALTQFKAQRADSSGTVDETGGTYLRAVMAFSISSLNTHNTNAWRLEYKLSTASSWTLLTSGNSYSYNNSSSPYLSGNILAGENRYHVRLTLSDYFTTLNYQLDISDSFVLVDYGEDGIGFGTSAGEKKMKVNMPIHLAHGIRYDGSGVYDSTDNVLGIKVNPARPTNINTIPVTGISGMTYLIVAGGPTGRPNVNGHLIHFSWDNRGKYDAQFFIPHSSLGSANGTTRVAHRGQQGGDWSASTWHYLIDDTGGQTINGDLTVAGNLSSNGNTVLTEGNYASYAVAKSGGLLISQVSVDNISVSGSSYKSDTFSASKSGYTPIAVAGYAFANASSSGVNCSHIFAYRMTLDGTNISYGIRNTNSQTAKIKISVNVLYLKN